MTGKSIVKKLGGGGLSLDLPMAALAAVSVGFVAYAMPETLFSGVVEASGLPSLLPAAQPPLGTTARAGVVGAGATLAFLCTWLLLRALGAPGPRSRKHEAAEVETPTLRLRRAAYHPDAPPSRPIVAALDLGEPGAEEFANEQEWDDASVFLNDPEPTDAIEAEWDVPVEPSYEERGIGLDPAEPALELEEPSIAHLMQRLELGLIRHRPQPMPVAALNDDAVVPPQPAADDRLRNALDDLQRLASRSA